MGRMLPSAFVHVLRRCSLFVPPAFSVPCACPCAGLFFVSCVWAVRGDLPVPGTNSTPRCSTFTCRVVTNFLPSLRSMSLSRTGSPARSMPCSCLVISVLPMRSGMRTLLAGTSVISFVLRSMLTNEGMISPVSLSTRSTTLPRLPVSRRFLRSSSENLCSLYSSSFCSLRMKCGTRLTLPSPSFLKERRASSSKASPPKLGDTLTKSDLP